MAYNVKQLRQISAGDGKSNSGVVKKVWAYTSNPDSIVDVQVSGYFNDASDLFTPGDLIRVAPNLTDGLDIEEFVVREIVAGVVNIDSSSFLEEESTSGADMEVMAFRFNTGTPPAPVNFKGNYRVIDAFIIHDVVSTGTGSTLTVSMAGGVLCTFTYPNGVVDKRTSLENDVLNTLVNNVTSSDAVSWVSSLPANTGEGTLYLLTVKTQ